jgi:hypothetical protein
MLGFFFIEAFLDLQIMVFFIFDRFFKEKEKDNKFNLLAFYFLFLGVSKIIMIINDYYLTKISPYFELIYLIGIGFAVLATIFFVHTSERMLPFNTRHLFSIAGLSLFTHAYVIFFIFNLSLEFLRIIFYILFPVCFLFVFISLFYLIIRTIGSIRRILIFIFFGLFLFGVGRALNTDYVEIIFGEIINLYGVIITVTALAIIGFSFRALPSLGELEWHKNLYSLLLVLTSNGVCLLRNNFQEKDTEQMIKIDADLLSGGLTGVMGIIKEMISQRNEDQYIQVIDHMDINIHIFKGNFITGVLIAKEEKAILLEKLEQLVKKFESRNLKYIQTFDGNIGRYKKDLDLIEIFKK